MPWCIEQSCSAPWHIMQVLAMQCEVPCRSAKCCSSVTTASKHARIPGSYALGRILDAHVLIVDGVFAGRKDVDTCVCDHAGQDGFLCMPA